MSIYRLNTTALSILLLIPGFSVFAADQTWKGGIDNQWTTPGNWSGNALPGPGDAVIYNGLSTGNLSNWLAQDFAIRSIVLSNVPAPVSLNSANTLTLTNGINMSNAIQSLTIAAPVVLGTTASFTNQTWGVASGQSLVVAGAVSGSGSLYKDNFGALYLNGTNTFTGNFTNNGGPVWLNNSAALGASAKTIYVANNLVGAGLHLNGTNGNIALPGTLTFLVSQNQGTIFNEAGDNSINGGLFEFSGGGNAFVVVNAGTLTLNGTIGLSTTPRFFMFGGPGNGTINGPINAAGLGIIKTDAGTWTLNNHGNTYAGSTTIQGGTLALGTNAALPNTPLITLVSNATFDVSAVTNTSYASNAFFLSTSAVQTLAGNGTVTGTVVSVGSGYLVPGGSNSVGTLSFSNNLVLNGSVTVAFDLNTATTPGGGVNDLVNVAGDLDPQFASIFITAQSPLTVGGTYRLFNYGGAEPNPFSSGVQTDTRYGLTLVDSGSGAVDVQVSGGNADLIWSGGGGATWDLAASPNWDSDSQVFYNADTVTFDDSSVNNIVTINSTVRPLSVLITNSSANYSFIGSGKITGPTGLTKSGGGVMVMSDNANDFTGPVTVNGGTLLVTNFATIGSVSALGAGNSIVLNGGTFMFGGPRPASGTVNRLWTLGANGGTLQSTNATFFLANQISGPGSLTKTGSVQVILGDIVTGVLSAGASNSYSGNTFITQGELQIRNAHALGLGKAVVSTGADLAVGGGVNYGLFTNNIDLNGGDGNGSAGTLQVNDANTVANFGGTISLLASSSMGTVNNGSLVTFTVSGPIVGPGALKKLGTNIVTLTCPSNSYSGGTLVSSGTLQLGNGGTAGTLGSGPVTNNSSLVFNHNDTTTNNTVISGTGPLTHKGAGTLVLGGANTYTGATTNSAGTLVVNGSLAGGSVVVAANATLGGYGVIGGPVTVQSAGTLALGAAIGTLAINNTLTLAGTNVMKLSKNGATVTNDLIQGLTTVTFGGTLSVTASGAALSPGDTFKLFNAATYAGTFAATNLPPLSVPFFWDTSGLTNGTLKVASSTLPPARFTSFTQLPNGSFQLVASNLAGTPYRLWATTNLALGPVTNTWTLLTSGAFNGLTTNLDAPAPGFRQRFYLITCP